MAEYAPPFIIDPDTILDQLEAREQLLEQAWAMGLERAYASAESKFSCEGIGQRLERAIYIVENDLVSFDSLGRMIVQSESRPEISYTVRRKPCECEDAQKEAAPNGFCKHRIASFIYAQASVNRDEIMAETESNGNGHEPDLWSEPEPAADAETGEVAEETPEPPVNYLINELPCKATIKWRDDQGMEIWVTIQDQNDRALLERTKKYQQYAHQQIERANPKGIAQFGTPSKGGSGGGKGGPWCGRHQKRYFKNDDGSYSHKSEDGSYCKASPEQVAKFNAA